MTPEEQATAHDANFVAAIELLASLTAKGAVRRFGAIPVAATGIALDFFNAAFILEPPDPEDLEAAVAFLRKRGAPFAVQVRSDLYSTLAAPEALGLTKGATHPCFALEPVRVPAPPPELAIRRVDRAEWSGFLSATAIGFELPLEMIQDLYPIAMLDDPRLRAFVGKLDGHPVAASMSIRTGATLGIYSIATVPEARGHGYGTAMTWHLLRDADPGWRVAVLQASPMGRPVYERMGFQLVREFVELTEAPPA